MKSTAIKSLPSWQIVAVHILFWCAYLAFLYYNMSNRFPGEQMPPNALRFGALFILPQVALVYLNMEGLVPAYFARKKYFWYFTWVILLLIVTYFLMDLVATKLMIREMSENGSRMGKPFFMPPKGAPPWTGRFNPAKGLASLNMILTVAMIFLSTTIKTSQLMLQQEKVEAQLKSENLDTELKFLRSQINPHFLFNALNNIYSLAVAKSESTPDYLIRLSDMLRYVIYDCNAEKVPLEKEIAYIKNFISLQKLKDDAIQNIELDIDENNGQIMIEPMLLIPFIENSFKHSKIEDLQKGWIELKLRTAHRKLDFTIKNSKPQEPFSKDQTGGVGLENVRRRLDLLYPDRHQLRIEDKDQSFEVYLTLLI